MSEWRPWLRSPRGQAALFAGTLLLAALLAGVAASQRSFFEGTHALALPAPSGRAVLLAERLRRGELSSEEVGALPGPLRAELAALPLQPEIPDRRALTPLLWAALPEEMATLVDRLLLAGTPAQQEEAIELANATGVPAAQEVLRSALQRAERRRDAPLAERLRLAILRETPGMLSGERGGTP